MLLVPNSREQQPKKVGAVLDRVSEVSCASEILAAKLGAQIDETQMIYPIQSSAKAKVADDYEMFNQEQTPCAPAEIELPQAVMPRCLDF